MNDNWCEISGVEIHLLGYFITDRDEFDFYARLPDFNLIEVYERRLKRGKGRWIAIQQADSENFLRVTAYRFSRY